MELKTEFREGEKNGEVKIKFQLLELISPKIFIFEYGSFDIDIISLIVFEIKGIELLVTR